MVGFNLSCRNAAAFRSRGQQKGRPPCVTGGCTIKFFVFCVFPICTSLFSTFSYHQVKFFQLGSRTSEEQRWSAGGFPITFQAGGDQLYPVRLRTCLFFSWGGKDKLGLSKSTPLRITLPSPCLVLKLGLLNNCNLPRIFWNPHIRLCSLMDRNVSIVNLYPGFNYR